MDVDRDADKVDFSQYGTSVRVSTALFVAGVTLTPGLPLFDVTRAAAASPAGRGGSHITCPSPGNPAGTFRGFFPRRVPPI